ncbi:MAG: hypothetical protein M0Q53_08910 [Prolixibacteraceae bacterium]|jgi:hypothetical protein|nr:hypothetical protein [Prolixibacteraceae bacterium]
MIADGTYDKIFNTYQHSKIEKLHLKDRKIFRIDNQLHGPETPFADKKLRFDPDWNSSGCDGTGKYANI